MITPKYNENNQAVCPVCGKVVTGEAMKVKIEKTGIVRRLNKGEQYNRYAHKLCHDVCH